MTLPESFHAYTPLHALSVGACGLGVLMLVVTGNAMAHTLRERQVRVVWVAFVVLVQTLNVGYYLMPARLDPAGSFPLQLCDIAGWIAAVALSVRVRWLRTVLFYFGFGLCTQAFVTPTLSEGPAMPKFWLFWLTHAQIVGSALYDFVVLRYRPSWRDYGVISLLLLAYGAVVLPIDIIWGLNYGYAGPVEPSKPTIIQSLGPWPLRLVWMWAIAQTMFAVLTVVGRAAPGRDPSARPGRVLASPPTCQ